MTRKHIYHRPAPFTSHRPVPAYTLLSPDGTRYARILDLHAFCIAHNLDFNAVYNLMRGDLNEVGGWMRG